MGLIVNSREYFSQFVNGEDFSLNASDNVDFLNSNVMEKMKFTSSVNISWDSAASTTNEWDYTRSGSTFTFTRTSGSFIADGWSTGDDFDVFYESGGPLGPFDADMTSVSDATIVFTSAALAASLTGTSGTSATFEIYGKTIIESLLYSFGLIENDESTNFDSKIDGQKQQFIVEFGNPQSTSFVPGAPVGTFFGWKSGTMQARFVTNPSTYVQQFEIEHEFVVVPYFRDGELSDLQNDVPPSDLFEGVLTLKYVNEMEFRNTFSNPNSAKTNLDDIQLGSTGWFNENYNGFTNQYSITSIAYEDSLGDSIDSLQVDGTTSVQIDVNSDDGTFDIGEAVMVYHSKLPTLDEYNEKTTFYETNWIYEGKRNTIDSVANSGTIITDLVITRIDANNIEVNFDITFNGSQQALLTEDSSYVLGVLVGNTVSGDENANSDRVVLLADSQNYIENTDVSGLLTMNKMEFVQHPDTLGGTQWTDYKGWIEDGVLIDYEFKLDLNLGAFLQSMNYRLVAYNSATGNEFNVDTYSFNLNSQTVVPESGFDTQQITIDTTRGYSLATGDQFNFVKLDTDTLTAGEQFYSGQLGVKISWQEWIALLNADTVFFDAAQDNDGLNKLSSNYSDANGYELRIDFEFIVSNGVVDTTYIARSPKIDILDYDEDRNGFWTATIQTFDLSSNNLDGTIPTNEDSVFKTTWDYTTDITDLSDYWVVHRIEEFESLSDKNIEECSSVNEVPTNQILQPLTGETQCKLTLVSGNIESECLVKGSRLDPNKNYKLSARLGTNSGAADPNKLMEDGTPKLKEDDVFKVIEFNI